MKTLALIATTIMLMTNITHAQDNWIMDTSKDVCVVKGSDQLRSPMYRETPESEEIMQLERDSCWMLANRDINGLGNNILHEHGLLFLDGGPILYGRDQQMAIFNQFLEIEDFFLTFEPVEAHVSRSNDMAWAFGIYKFQMPGQDMEVGKYTSVWQRDAENNWVNVSEMRNPFQK